MTAVKIVWAGSKFGKNMNRVINQINVSITTNRTCTLRCDHCYIAPHLFDDRSQMTTETFRLIFDRINELYDLDGRLDEIEWEAIGGETTMMPFAWWEENLPYALGKITEINKKIGKSGALNFLTNLVYSDKRYTDLINEYANHPAFCLYTSWEPDTNRFGKNNKLFPKFLKTLESIKSDKKILDVILTRTVIEMGPQYLIDTFVGRGITDFSIKMLSPYGSGKQFFKENMIDFKSMSDYLIKLGKIKPDFVTYTPQDEMLSSLFRGTSFQCNGNFQYDLAIETDGSTTFNANQTADEASLGSRKIELRDPLWAQKVMYENKKEENNKLSLSHPICRQCEYMRYCNAGWYHYKIHDAEEIRRYDKEECSGYKAMWDEQKRALQGSLFDVSVRLHNEAVDRAKSSSMMPQEAPDALIRDRNEVRESDMEKKYNSYFLQIGTLCSDSVIILDVKKKYQKNVAERIWYYEGLGKKTRIENQELIDEIIVTHWLYRNYKHVDISVGLIKDWLNKNQETVIAKDVLSAIAYLGGEKSETDLIPDSRNEELFRTMIDLGFVDVGQKMPNEPYLIKLKMLRNIEKSNVGK